MSSIIDKRRGGGAGSDMSQQATQRAIDTQVPNHVKTGAKLSSVTIGPAASIAVPHKLGRVPIGWHTMRVTGTGVGANVVERAADANTITFARETGSTGSLTYDFWVF